jgi:hypothetical protein
MVNGRSSIPGWFLILYGNRRKVHSLLRSMRCMMIPFRYGWRSRHVMWLVGGARVRSQYEERAFYPSTFLPLLCCFYGHT